MCRSRGGDRRGARASEAQAVERVDSGEEAGWGEEERKSGGASGHCLSTCQIITSVYCVHTESYRVKEKRKTSKLSSYFERPGGTYVGSSGVGALPEHWRRHLRVSGVIPLRPRRSLLAATLGGTREGRPLVKRL